MANARDVTSDAPKKILLLGDTGAGKTTQFLTLPGKKYAYLFDPNAKLSLRGHDVDYDEYLPDPINAAIKPLTKEKAGDRPTATGSDVYLQFEREFNERLTNGFFEPYDWIAFDSATTLLDLMMDRVLTINGRYGHWPNQDDYGPQMVAFINLCRNITAMNKGIFVTGHLEDRQDKLTKKIGRQPMMTGRLIAKIPLLFSEVLGADCDVSSEGTPQYSLQTVKDKEFALVRTSIKGLEPFENVTIDFTKDPVGQGLGGILEWERKQRG